ncbi:MULTISPECIES: low molecular weight protein-tyrosine-phosphatase [Marinobacter]|uniref:protein-tyrosine-phosphatase n=1 Tax=Marinobacter profundi TaxID=2666256 RepID=A0A2G1UP51_9GAMM|nr:MULTISPECIES: low molecular weight protein-tyrosine-phosphatase [Marinobacter]MBD3656296.1 low molecular weight phosphotyrosine protein phosphatase [Marinobacter sp.]PHQ16287.1 phosphotyrosine protein phosphatase [Marinobacter profundi]
MAESVQVLFVCLGNICRSPTAHGVFAHKVARAGLADRVVIDSCGTGHWHVGSPPDSRALEAAGRRGVDLSGLRARQLCPADLDTFDYVLVMDRQNLADVRDVWRQNGGTEPELFLGYGRMGLMDEVPDPYYGGDRGFDDVLDLIEDASDGLLDAIRGRLA